jgi:hypothetical protein
MRSGPRRSNGQVDLPFRPNTGRFELACETKLLREDGLITLIDPSCFCCLFSNMFLLLVFKTITFSEGGRGRCESFRPTVASDSGGGKHRNEPTAEHRGAGFKMSTLHFVKAGPGRQGKASQSLARHSISGLIAVLLIALLGFTTVTVWVQGSWALQFFQMGIYTLVIVQIVFGIRNQGESTLGDIRPLLICAIPLWGIIQLLGHTTSSSFATRGEVLRWGALSGVFYLTWTVVQFQSSRRKFLTAFVCFATAMAILCVMQLNTSHGKILWLIDTRYGDIYGTFQNKNNYCQFVELALPVALWGAMRQGWRSWWRALASGILYASVIGAASRAGFALCTAELITIPVIGLAKLRKNRTRSAVTSTASILLVIPTIAATFTVAVGWRPIWQRFQGNDPYAIRREYALGAIDMVKHRPFTGYGLGTFEYVYQRYTTKDSPLVANHAHNDWAEFAAEGGVPFLLLIGIPFFGAMPSAIRRPWALGLVATIMNAFVDYPFPRPAVSGWMFALLAMLYTTSRPERANPGNREEHDGGPYT